eukprot:TRINITY_DN3901_c0_g1_i2.p1 TRINITY_DN3901_c0_g1~~TRINITY_DN3901_c0_g1_i2.p1  ORF type:complete len:461 (-),score=121.48 TRINITY_DN3901_c0_g1_i2:156-1451(-)
MVLYLCGDIGGTNSRLQLLSLDEKGVEALVKEKTFPSKNFPSLTSVIWEFLQEEKPFVGDKEKWPLVACFALAGPVVNGVCHFTNVNWRIDQKEMEESLHLEKVSLMNDFVGLGYGLLDLKAEDKVVLNDAPVVPGAPIACLGAGTGLGEVFLTHNGSDYTAWPTEGGHTDLCCNNYIDHELLEFVRAKHTINHVSVERVVCGTGLANIYEFLVKKFPEQANPETNEQFGKEGVAVVTEKGLNGSDPLCVEALNIFARKYGEEAGNLALKTTPNGGLYIAGGIAPRILKVLQDHSKFLEYFLDKGRMRDRVLRNIPVFVVTHKDPGLLGTRVICRRMLASCGKSSSVTSSAPLTSSLSLSLSTDDTAPKTATATVTLSPPSSSPALPLSHSSSQSKEGSHLGFGLGGKIGLVVAVLAVGLVAFQLGKRSKY